MEWPHRLQNWLFAGGVDPHFGQVTSISIDEPHCVQNKESSGFSVWHFGHFIDYALLREV